MPKTDPLGFIEMVERDLDRLTGRTGMKLPRPELPPLPALPETGGNAREPRTPPELLASLPNHLTETVQEGLQLVTELPGRLMEDATTALNNLLRLPREVSRELFMTPGLLAERLVPANINKALATIRESADFSKVTGPTQRREKMRTLTDVIDLFTPT